MTEKQGGSDVRANTTRAVPTPGGPLRGRHLPAHRPQVVLLGADERRLPRARPGARADSPASSCRVPSTTAAATPSPCNASRTSSATTRTPRARSSSTAPGAAGSATRAGACARSSTWCSATRLDCVLGSAATMRDAVARAVHHARHRSAFGALLVDQPLMRNVLADLALEAEAATVLGLRLAHAVDTGESELARLGVALGKFWVCKRTRRWSPRRSSASAATATSRRTVSPGSTARRRSTPSGRARATSTPSTSCAPSRASRRRSRP